jgi:hypothetical protein
VVVCRNVGRLCAVWCSYEGFARVVLGTSKINMFAYMYGGEITVGTRRRDCTFCRMRPLIARARVGEAWPHAVGSCEAKVRELKGIGHILWKHQKRQKLIFEGYNTVPRPACLCPLMYAA